MTESVRSDEQKRAYQRALTWGDEQLLPPPIRQSFATWFAKFGHDLFMNVEKAFRWWSAEQPGIEQED